MSNQPLNLATSLLVLWRRRLMLAVLAIVGAAVGVGYSVVSEPMSAAIALVLLPPSNLASPGQATRDMNTELVIARSNPVLQAAGRSVSPPIGPLQLAHRVTVTSLSQDIIQIQARAPVARDAELLANAVASDYIQFATRVNEKTIGASVAGLQRESSQLTQQLVNLQNEISQVSQRMSGESPASSAGQQDASQLGALNQEQHQVALDLDNLNSQILTAQVSNDVAAGATRILEKATSVLPMSKLRSPLDAAAGLGGGLLLAAVAALVGSQRDRHLRLRDHIAETMGAPVIATLSSDPVRGAKGWEDLLQRSKPSPLDSLSVRRVLRRLSTAGSGQTELRVVSLADDAPALAAGVRLALFATALGAPTVIAVGEHPALEPLRAAFVVQRRRPLGNRMPVLATPTISQRDVQPPITISIVAADATSPKLPPSANPSLFAISSGFASAETLARLALAAEEAGSPIDGILLVNPDPSDNTTGTHLAESSFAGTSRTQTLANTDFQPEGRSS